MSTPSISPVVVPADPREVLLSWLEPILPQILPGWRCGWRQDQGLVSNISPGQFIALDVLSDVQRSHVHDEYVILIQIWGPDGLTDDKIRTRAARIISAHAHRGLNARRNSGPISLPDPFDPALTGRRRVDADPTQAVRSITQVTMTALLKGEDL